MRVRLFTLLVVPIVAVMVLAALFLDERGERYNAAETAFSAAVIADEVAALDKALGDEALASSQLAQTSATSARASAFAKLTLASSLTDLELEKVVARLEERPYHPELSGALEVVKATLAFRSDVADGLASPLQMLDRYSHIRGVLIDALATQALALTTAEGQQHLLALVDLIEARSAHLDERVSVDLARRYGAWAPGLHSAVVASIADQNAHLDNANRFLFGSEVTAPQLLIAWRKQIVVSDDAPNVSARAWAALSDSWLADMDGEIAQQRARTMDFLAEEVATAEDARFAAIIGVSAATLAAMLIASVVAVRLVRRVSIITQQARRMAAGLQTRRTSPDVSGSDELGQLATAFDEMISQIETRTTNQWIESTVLESIVHGESIDTVLDLTAPLLGVTEDGIPRYRITSDTDSNILVEPTSESIESAHGHAGPLPIEQLADTPEARTVLGLVRMAHQRDADHTKLAWQATRDELTGLLNRGAILTEALNIECNDDGPGRRAGLLYVDLDGFKAINDQFGHSAGDRVLVTQSQRLTDLITRAGGVVGRLGGDEFLIVVPEVDGEAALIELAAHVVSDLGAPTPSSNGTFHVSASVGGVMARPGVAPLKLLNDADAALYNAKKLGRRQAVISTKKLRDAILETEQLRQDVLNGTEREEFKPWFQPIWGEGGATLVGMEALARWEHPERGMVSPAIFLPVAEEMNLLPQLDRMMFEAVCAQAVVWLNAGYFLEFVHYNLSTAWLEDPGFVSDTAGILAQTGCPPQAVVAEVTESGLMTDIGSNSHRLQKLREAGIRIAVDDFGQGYSSLAYLSDLPVDLLKIDRRFVDRVDEEESNQAIVSAIVSLGRSLDLHIVAEGLERPEELDFLAAVGCDLFQGFLLARPSPAAEATALLARSRAPSHDRPPFEVAAVQAPQLDMPRKSS
ncbi:MAG: EAL domain-containing protein [Acidimicrobiales bacterium]